MAAVVWTVRLKEVVVVRVGVGAEEGTCVRTCECCLFVAELLLVCCCPVAM